MFNHRETPNCLRCGATLVLHAVEGEGSISLTDQQWQCRDCGSQRPVVYRVKRGLKKTA